MLITNWESAENLGDYAILCAQVRLLEESGGMTVAILGNQPSVAVPAALADRHCGDAPWPSPSRRGLTTWSRSLAACLAILLYPPISRLLPEDYRRVVRLLSTADIVMPKGGGYLIADGSLRKVLFLARTLFPLMLARRLRVRRVLWGHSIGPARGRIGRALIRTALKDASIAVRDDASLALCHEFGLAAQRAPDLAFLTQPESARGPADASDGCRVVNVGLTAKRISACAAIQHQYLRSLAAAVTSICAAIREDGRRAEVHLIPQVTGPTPSEDDRPVLREVVDLLCSEDCVVASPPDDIESALTAYGHLDFLVATRAHSAVLSACAGTPFFVFGYIGGKAQGMVQDLGLPEWTTTDLSREIPAHALKCYQSRDALRTQIARGLPAARKRIRDLRLPTDVAAAAPGVPR